MSLQPVLIANHLIPCYLVFEVITRPSCHSEGVSRVKHALSLSEVISEILRFAQDDIWLRMTCRAKDDVGLRMRPAS